MVIELSTDWELDEQPTPWRPRPRTRRIAGLVVCLLLLSFLAGSGSTSLVRRIASVPGLLGSTCTLIGDRLFVTTPLAAAASTELAAYRARDGHPLWHTTLPTPPQVLQAGPADVVVLGFFNYAADPGEPIHDRFAGLDAETGRVRWSLSNAGLISDLDYTGPHLLFSVASPDGGNDLRLIDLRSGRPVWSWAMPTGSRAQGVQGGRVLVTSPDGATQVLDRETARSMVSGKLVIPPRPPATAAAPVFAPAAFSVGDQVLVTDPQHGRTGITSYDLATLRPRWHGEVDDVVSMVSDCGAVVCVSGNAAMIALDPATGRRRWGTTSWMWAQPVGDWLEVTGPNADAAQNVLVDPVSGRLLFRLGDWTVLGAVAPDAPAVVVNGRAANGMWVGLLGDGPRVLPEAFLPGAIVNRCTAGGVGSTYVACATVAGPIQLWKVG